MGVSKTFMKYIEHSKNNKKSMNKYYNNLLPISFFFFSSPRTSRVR